MPLLKAPINLKRQAGFAIESVALALLVMSLAAALTYKATQQADQVSMAVIQADGLKNVANAAETLVMEHYDSYQAGLPITRNGVTLAFGAASGESMTPTLANLRAMAVGLTPGTDLGNYKTLVDATYITQIQRVPAGCELSPAGQTCNIQGMVCMDRPVQDIGSPAGETDDVGIGAIMGRIGGDSGTSFQGSGGTITGAGGSWTRANPFAGTPVGLVCQRFGFGSAAFGRFLRVRDSRNPDFQGALTVNNNIYTTTGGVGAGSSDPANPTAPTTCRLGEILNSGEILTRSASCIKRTWQNPTTGEVGVADAAGMPRAVLNETGEIISKDAAGNVKAGFTYAGTESNAKADRIQTNAGTAGLRPNGEAFGDSVVINTDAAVGGACPTNKAMVWGNGTSSLKLLKCVANFWVATGTAVGAIGDVCPINGQLGETPAGVSVICVNNVWQTTTSRIGNWAVSSTLLVGHTNVVTKPVCGSGSTPKIIAIPKAINSTTLYVNFDVQDNGPSWTILMVDGEDNPAWSTAIAQLGCFYN